ncbi:hypothetical protein [Photobacterium sp. TY1-4]|uniref:hypothetical protein n=1 Tax=Photobacterium sp. TY1-4 TaxID=2899122 RepID=UPI0021C0563B|nr:hypothetical protein [Photobacterium sp. TY1-4]UXI02609.1 hypothetical protein NH461_07550 [Photobacterium sp. TY1-4]
MKYAALVNNNETIQAANNIRPRCDGNIGIRPSRELEMENNLSYVPVSPTEPTR